MQAAMRQSHTHSEQERRAEGEDCGDEGGDHAPDAHSVQKDISPTKLEARPSFVEAAPHPSDRRQMREEHKRKAQAQGAG